MSPRRRTGFTLIELLVVIAIIAILIGLLVPAVQKVRESAANLQCSNNMKQLILACHNFENMYKRWQTFGDPVCGLSNNNTNGSWIIPILPFFEQQTVFDSLVSGSTTDQATLLPILFCPMDTRNIDECIFTGWGAPYYAPTDYVAIAGLDYYSTAANQVGVLNQIGFLTVGSGPLAAGYATRMTQITDGTSNTVVIGERPISCDLYWGWWTYNSGADTVTGTANTSFTLGNDSIGGGGCTNGVGTCPASGPFYFGSGPRQTSNCCSMDQLWSSHNVGAYFAFADGSVRMIAYYNANPTVVDLSTMAGGELIPGDLD
jgi:prepilin-type N-terminal cleavage/methylation domain-containing protein/prepilin-type processing-associated H-X9-DG protein